MSVLFPTAKKGLCIPVLGALLLCAAGCGYRGPLYLPEEAPGSPQPTVSEGATEEPSDGGEDEDDA